MFIFSIPINFIGFNWTEFRTPALPAGVCAKLGSVCVNATKALSPWDLAVSASLNFQHRYEEHVLLEEPPDAVQPGPEPEAVAVGKSSQ